MSQQLIANLGSDGSVACSSDEKKKNAVIIIVGE